MSRALHATALLESGRASFDGAAITGVAEMG